MAASNAKAATPKVLDSFTWQGVNRKGKKVKGESYRPPVCLS